MGWGVHCLSEIAQGRWRFPSHKIMLNILELRAAFCTLQGFHQLTNGALVLLRLNTTTVSYIKRQGGTHSLSLLQEVEQIMSWAQKNLGSLSVVYVPRVENIQVDFLSRV